MPQLQTLVLTDRAATPVNHTYVPRDIKAGVAEVVESSGIPIGDNRVTVRLNRTASGRYKPQVNFTFPVVQTKTENGISTPVVVRTAYCNVEFTFDPASTLDERNNVVGMVSSAFAATKPLINDTVVKLEGVY